MIWIPDIPAEEKIELCKKGEVDPFYVYHTICPSCGKPFKSWYTNDENDPLFLPFNEFAQKIIKNSDVFVVGEV